MEFCKIKWEEYEYHNEVYFILGKTNGERNLICSRPERRHMPNDYEKITRTELHRVQTKVNSKEKAEKVENIIMGWFLILGVLITNFIAPNFGISEFMHISSKLGPLDCLALLLGARFLWKGYS